MNDLLSKLAKELNALGFQGELEKDWSFRTAASTDNSIYQIEPDAVAYPTSAADVRVFLDVLNQHSFDDIHLTARGAATGTNGQSLNTGIVLDFRRHMTSAGERNLDEGWIDVEPGISLDRVNHELDGSGLFFAPDTSTANRCTIGGMISTDACGQGSRVFGKTSDNILELNVLLADGSALTLRPISDDELDRKIAEGDASAAALQRMRMVCDAGRPALIDKVPKLTRHFVGFDLINARPASDLFNPVRLVTGAEGTLAVITRARLKLRARPKHKRLVVVGYRDFPAALESAKELISFDPDAVETIDDRILTTAADHGLLKRVPESFSAPLLDGGRPAMNYVEFSGGDPEHVANEADALENALAANDAVIAIRQTADVQEMSALWDIRKLSVGLLANMKGTRRPIALMENCVVPPESLSAFAADVRTLLDSYGLAYGMFGHVDVGCLHIRPALNVSDDLDRRIVKEISDRVCQLSAKHGGLFWGEHGKGVRGEYLPDVVGKEVYAAFAKIKRAFDPANRLNPGKLVTPDGDKSRLYSIDGTPFREMSPTEKDTPFIDAYRCNGNAHCQSKVSKSPMCPSFRTTGDVRHSPKGRADVMRGWLNARASRVPVGGDRGFSTRMSLAGIFMCRD